MLSRQVTDIRLVTNTRLEVVRMPVEETTSREEAEGLEQTRSEEKPLQAVGGKHAREEEHDR